MKCWVCVRVWPLPDVATMWSPLGLLCGAGASILSGSISGERRKQPTQTASSLLCTKSSLFLERALFDMSSASSRRAWARRLMLLCWWGDSPCLHRWLRGCCSSSLHTSLPGPPHPASLTVHLCVNQCAQACRKSSVILRVVSKHCLLFRKAKQTFHRRSCFLWASLLFILTAGWLFHSNLLIIHPGVLCGTW